MSFEIDIEIIGLEELSCGPFPCNDERSCELTECAPGEKLLPAVAALEKALKKEYGDTVSLHLTLIDDGLPQRIRSIIEEHQPPLPIILINRRVTPIGRISLPLIRAEIEKELKSSST
ncbi:MAG: Uncharacterized protein XE11_0527 [Methanomicrobiales archaeon 53_19]|jgi:hypothetical protein|uniref:hypothetical protein n=1 Tax=Methanocalculus sp. TaxID=2004547 RepID=UPI00074A1E5F|nr:hypothetical protein [Methanocalculus sp.]KUK71204.1 MAG: Uncharacterized protein XD88_0197 [Methanocalculus sp. 52_23]KUL04747.1 MAG: Uncharacterized protein XE11_0527 [Methanomicrobiales archaeon 53_19]HIJ06963.1 hypothetical protein [Methanocalculus sp.]